MNLTMKTNNMNPNNFGWINIQNTTHHKPTKFKIHDKNIIHKNQPSKG
jgi:hypothetical protein